MEEIDYLYFTQTFCGDQEDIFLHAECIFGCMHSEGISPSPESSDMDQWQWPDIEFDGGFSRVNSGFIKTRICVVVKICFYLLI